MVRRISIKAFVLLSFALFLSGCARSKPAVEDEPKPKKIPIADLPLVKLLPHPDGHKLGVYITAIKSNIIDYQVVYSATVKGNPVERGAGGRSIKITDSTLTRDGKNAVVFGSESSGKFKYDENVGSGSLEITYRDDKNKSKGRADLKWELIGPETDKPYTTLDNYLTINFPQQTKDWFIYQSTLGSPLTLPDRAVGPFAVYSSGKTLSNLNLQLNSPAAGMQFYALSPDSASWKLMSPDANKNVNLSTGTLFILAP